MYGATFTINSAKIPPRFIRTKLELLIWRKEPGILHEATSLCLCPNIVHWMKMVSDVTVGAVASSFAMCVCCVLQLAHARALISPDHFSVRNIWDVSALQQSSWVSLLGSIGLKHLRVWRCVSSLVIASLPRVVNLWSPALRPYCFFVIGISDENCVSSVEHYIMAYWAIMYSSVMARSTLQPLASR